MQRFLIIKMSALGDLVHNLPAVALLKQELPQCEVHWFAKKHPSQILAGNPDISRIITDDGGGMLDIIKKLRRFRYDAVFDLQGLFKSAFFTSIVRASQKIGFNSDEIREYGAQFLYTLRIQPNKFHPHVIFRSISVIAQFLNLDEKKYVRPESWIFKLPVCETATKYVQSKLPTRSSSKLVVLNPGAAWETKRWAPENFAKLAEILTNSLDVHFALAYSPVERNLAENIIASAKSAKIYNFETNLSQLVELIRVADLFVSGDTGPLQIAYGLGTPAISIFGPTNPLRNGAFRANDLFGTASATHLSCLNCHKRKCPKYQIVPPPCMQIPAEHIAHLAQQKLQH